MAEAKKTVSLGDVTKAAHAMQNVLLLLHAHTQVLQERLTGEELKGKHALAVKEVKAIYFNTRRLSKLLDSMLIYEKAEYLDHLLKKEHIDLCELVLSLIQEYRAAFPKVIFTVKLPLELFVPVDKEKMIIVLRNIIENAIKYGKNLEGGRQVVVISMRKTVEKNCLIAIKDQGGGIDSQDLSKIFLPFYRGRQGINKQGSGLGLAISQEIMRLHKGKVSVVSKRGGGTEFVLTIPL